QVSWPLRGGGPDNGGRSSRIPWSLPTASLSWALSDVVTIVAEGLVAHRVHAGAGRFRREGGHDARGNGAHTAYAVMGRPGEPGCCGGDPLLWPAVRVGGAASRRARHGELHVL